MTPQNTHHAWLLVLAVVTAGCADVRSPTAEPRINRAVVVEVVDGDTVRLNLAGRIESVRLIGIDTPETKHPTRGIECFGPEATSFLTALLPPGTALRVERDAQARDADGRLLLYLFLAHVDGERFVNLEMVVRGLARPLGIEPNVRYERNFVDAAFDAQRNSRGLWAACK